MVSLCTSLECAFEREFANSLGLVIIEDRTLKSSCECSVVDKGFQSQAPKFINTP